MQTGMKTPAEHSTDLPEHERRIGQPLQELGSALVHFIKYLTSATIARTRSARIRIDQIQWSPMPKPSIIPHPFIILVSFAFCAAVGCAQPTVRR